MATTGTCERPGIGPEVTDHGWRPGGVDDRDHLAAAVAQHAERGLGGVVAEGALCQDHQPLRRGRARSRPLEIH